jgi:peptidoglycan/LPS O-acetylase OafA/YrhL
METAPSEIHERQFDALNAFRGVGAAIVALFHFNLIIYSHLSSLVFLKHTYIMLDFFFVLSGFVIAHSYQKRLLEGYPIGKFMFRRFWRVYPLHIFALMLFVGLELLKYLVPIGEPPFSTEYKSTESLVANFFLLQAMGLFNVATWNGPSWSVSVEFYTYVTYALALVVFRHRIWMVCAATAVAIPLIFLMTGVKTLDMTADGAFMRSLYGFSAGVVSYHLYLYLKNFTDWQKYLPRMEMVFLPVTFLFLVFCGGNEFSLLSPYVLMINCVIVAFERGRVSAFMKKKIFLAMALLSYSAYMLHYFILNAILNIGKIVQGMTGVEVFKVIELLPGRFSPVIHFGPWFGDIVHVLFLLIVFGCSYFTCKYIELPIYKWSKRVTQDWNPKPKTTALENA